MLFSIQASLVGRTLFYHAISYMTNAMAEKSNIYRDVNVNCLASLVSDIPPLMSVVLHSAAFSHKICEAKLKLEKESEKVKCKKK